MKHGAAGYGVYFMIVEKLRESADYKCVKDYNVIAFDLRVDTQIVKSVVEDFGLFAFADDGKCFYSESLTRRMAHLDEIREGYARRGRTGMEKRWGGEKDITTLSENDNTVITTLSENDNNKSKVNKSKLKREINLSLVGGQSPPCERAEKTDFDIFWCAYPKKTGKGDAKKKFDKAIARASLETMLSAIERQKESRQWAEDDGKYIPNPATWLYQDRWLDEPQNAGGTGNGDGKKNGLRGSPKRADGYIAPAEGVFSGVTGRFDDVSNLPDPFARGEVQGDDDDGRVHP